MGKSDRTTMAANDIKVVAANSKGKDYFIGDLHGNSGVLDAVLNKMTPNDRLILLGDLTDRGKDSPGVIKLINEVNSSYPGTILSIRGNHEKLTLDSIAGLETIANHINSLNSVPELKEFMEEVKTTDINTVSERYGAAGIQIRNHLRNGGHWLVMLFARELLEDKIIINEETNEVSYTKESEVYLIKKYMDSLSYISHIEGKPGTIPAQGVHADMPISEAEVIKRVIEGTGLTEEEKEYAMWARENNHSSITMSNKGRTPTSPVAFVGHNIVDNEETSPLRLDTNTIDLDIASYQNNIAALFCLTDGTCEFVGEGAEEAMKNPALVAILETYKQKGMEIQLLNRMSLELSCCSSSEEIHDVILGTADRFESHATLSPALKHTYKSLFEFAYKNGMISYENVTDLARIQVLDKIADTLANDKARLPAALKEWAQALGQDVKSLIDYAVREGVLTPQLACWCSFGQPGKGTSSKLFSGVKEVTPDNLSVPSTSPRKLG